MIETMVLVILGLVIGAVSVWLILQSNISAAATQAKSESQIDLALLNERLAASHQENSRLNTERQNTQGQVTKFQIEVSELQNSNAQLLERAARMPEMQSAIDTAQHKIQELKQLDADMREKLGAAESTIVSQIQQIKERTDRIAELQNAVNSANSMIQQLKKIDADMREKLGSTESTNVSQAQYIQQLSSDKVELALLRDQLITEQQLLKSKIAELTTSLDAERTQTGEKLALLQNAEEQLSNRFKALANEILDDKSKKFTDQNKTNLDQLLEPLKLKITEFQGKVNEVYVQESKDRSALSEQVKQLMELNNKLSADAHNLTSALKGSSKTQGNWGEFILESVLEASGLRKGHEYTVQESHTREDGSRAMPDVVINLPEERHLIVDAKVSLTAYEQYANADTDGERHSALKNHLASVRAHIKGLSDKNYQLLYGVKSLDFVLMFIPVEPAFMLAIAQDSKLWQDAWDKNILLVSPSTLLFVVRTVAHLWKQENQNKNAQEIAKQGADLYDKLVGFAEDFVKVGDRINHAQREYDSAFNKLKTGRGNLIGRAVKLKKLGLNTTKQFSVDLIGHEDDDAEQNEFASI